MPKFQKKLFHYYDDHDIINYLECTWPADYTTDTLPSAALIDHKEDRTNFIWVTKYGKTESENNALLIELF